MIEKVNNAKFPVMKTTGADRYDLLAAPGNNWSYYLTGIMTTGTNATTLVISRRSCVKFIGAADTLAVPNNAALQPGTSDFCLSFWMKTSDVSLTDILEKIDATSGYEFNTTAAGLLQAKLMAGGKSITLATERAVNDGKWHHVALWGDRDVETGLVLYLDGDEEDRASGTGSEEFATDLGGSITGGAGVSLDLNGTNSKTLYLSAVSLYVATDITSTSPTIVADLYNNGIGKKATGSETDLSWALNLDEGTSTTVHDMTSTQDGTITWGGTGDWAGGGCPIDSGDSDDELGPITLLVNDGNEASSPCMAFPHDIKIGRNNPLTITTTAACYLLLFGRIDAP